MGDLGGKKLDEEAGIPAFDEHDNGMGDHGYGELSAGKSSFLGRMLARMAGWENWLDVKLGVESQGVRRVEQTERHSPKLWMMFLMWSSTGTYSIAGVTTGFIPWQYGLSLSQGIGILALGSVLGAACSAWCGIFGPGTGLRQITISRYSFGWWPSKILSICNVIILIGWGAFGCIAGGQALTALNHNLSTVVGILIVAIISLLISFGGYQALIRAEAYLWIPFFILCMVILGEAGSKASIGAPATITGASASGAMLNWFAVSFGSSAAFCSMISDYFVHYPQDISQSKVFLLSCLGIAIPATLGPAIGCVLGSAMQVNQSYADAYNNGGFGDLLLAMMYPTPFVKFMLVILSMGNVGQTTVAFYSISLAIHQFALSLQAIPRFIWSLVTFGVVIALAIAGQDKILVFLNAELSLLGNYNLIIGAIFIVEHYIFRGGDFGNYDLVNWNNPSTVPVGIAALIAFLSGWVASVLGMCQSFYVGVIAKHIGDTGGEVGLEMSLVFTVVFYIPLRYFERQYFGR